jgi:hypothetical protein
MRYACFLALIFVVSSPVWAQQPKPWTATSTTSLSITGNIRVTPTSMTFQNGKSIAIQDAGTVTLKSPITGEVTQGQLYRVTSQTNPALLQGTTLCGRSGPKWIVIVKTKPMGADVDPRSVMIYETAQKPPAGSNCAIYNYDAGK